MNKTALNLKSKRTYFIIAVFLLIAVTLCFIWGNSLKNQSQSSESSGKVYVFFNKIISPLFGEGVLTHSVFRELAHFTEFFVLGGEVSLLCILVKKFRIKTMSVVLPFGLLVGVTDECLQLLNDRACEFIDMAIDFSGYFTCVAIIFLAYLFVKRKKKTKNTEEKEKA